MSRALAVITAALLFAPAASAKQITAIEVCGADGCVDLGVPSGLHE